MSAPINLNRARKDRERKQAKADAATNRAKHGLTKAERLKQRQAAEKDRRSLDGARRETPSESD
jgi:hypothetical protein